jgi:hypothetical protein
MLGGQQHVFHVEAAEAHEIAAKIRAVRPLPR